MGEINVQLNLFWFFFKEVCLYHWLHLTHLFKKHLTTWGGGVSQYGTCQNELLRLWVVRVKKQRCHSSLFLIIFTATLALAPQMKNLNEQALSVRLKLPLSLSVE